jgi:tRNA A-37 threonylcarbamoyl transferase component Bud32
MKAIEVSLKHRLENILESRIVSNELLHGGVNAAVYKIVTEDASYAVKDYSKLSNSTSRIYREISFLKYCSKIGFSRVPAIVWFDNKEKLLVMQFIDGRKEVTSKELCLEILEFIRIVQEKNSESTDRDLPQAADAMFHLSDLESDIRKRIAGQQLVGASKVYEDALNTLNSTLQVKSDVQEMEVFIKRFKREMVSPSDLGPHNVIWQSKKAFFIDFDYAGLDSNIKLGLDLLVQPELNMQKFLPDINQSFQEVLGFFPNEVPSSLIKLFVCKWKLIRERLMQNVGPEREGAWLVGK